MDGELEANIELLRETHQKYLNILRLAKLLTTHFYNTVATQAALGECFSDLAQKSPELQQEFLYNAETQKNLSKNGETLLGKRAGPDSIHAPPIVLFGANHSLT